jgi:hypothetical protein
MFIRIGPLLAPKLICQHMVRVSICCHHSNFLCRQLFLFSWNLYSGTVLLETSYVATETSHTHSPSFITALKHSSMNQNQPLKAWEGVSPNEGVKTRRSTRIASVSSYRRPQTSSANVVSPVEANKNPVPQPYLSQRGGTPADRYPQNTPNRESCSNEDAFNLGTNGEDFSFFDTLSESGMEEDSGSDITMTSGKEAIGQLRAVNEDLKSESHYYRLMAEITMKTAALRRGCECTYDSINRDPC